MLAVDGLVAGYGARIVLEDVSFEARAGERIAVLGPNGGGKTTLFRVLLRELVPVAGSVRGADRFAVVPQTERSRLDYPVDALDVALMGALAGARGGGARPTATASRRARRSTPSGSPTSPTRRSATSPAASASACWSPVRSCRTRRCCCSTSRSAASTP